MTDNNMAAQADDLSSVSGGQSLDANGQPRKRPWRSEMRFDALPDGLPHLAPASISFEFFPPKTEALEQQLWQCIHRLKVLSPRFVSVTYGAGGSTQARTFSTLKRILAETDLVPAAHLTCVGASSASVDEIAEQYWEAGVRHIVALRGDAPAGEKYAPHQDGYAYASDLVTGLKKRRNFEISVAAYPEGHPDAVDLDRDLDHLKRKIDAGADRAITQYFFDTPVYLRFLDKALAAGINTPIVPGIMPVTNFAQAAKFSAMCGASVPKWLAEMFEGLDDDPDTRRAVAACVASEQVRVLQANGIDEFHFYTLNRPDLSYAIAHVLGVRPQKASND